MRLTLTSSALMAAVAVVISGCGGGDSTASSEVLQQPIVVESGKLTKKEFLEQAEAICQEAKHQFGEEVISLLQGKQGVAALNALHSLKPAQSEALVNEIFIPSREMQIEEVSSLGAPQGDEKVVTTMLKGIQQGLREAKQQPVKFAHSPITDFAGFARSEKVAEAYGLGTCWQG